jgi:hypothetical protein
MALAFSGVKSTAASTLGMHVPGLRFLLMPVNSSPQRSQLHFRCSH